MSSTKALNICFCCGKSQNDDNIDTMTSMSPLLGPLLGASLGAEHFMHLTLFVSFSPLNHPMQLAL